MMMNEIKTIIAKEYNANYKKLPPIGCPHNYFGYLVTDVNKNEIVKSFDTSAGKRRE
jgi:hypothetical protein